MPFENSIFDCVICVGTVINYCEIEKAIKEISRVSKENALLVLEYERSGSGLVVSHLRNNNTIVFEHSYFNEPHKNLLYSDKYVKKVLTNYNYKILQNKKFNTTIPFFEMFISEKKAHNLTIFEPIIRNIPIINSFSHNEILICKKQ